jgi:hypothetical protein
MFLVKSIAGFFNDFFTHEHLPVSGMTTSMSKNMLPIEYKFGVFFTYHYIDFYC